MTKILIIGLPSGASGDSFERQLGNVAILIPTIKMLKDSFPNAQISTNFQLSEGFCRKHGITSIRDPAVWSFATRYILKSVVNLLRCLLWRSFQKIGLNAETLIRERKLKQFTAADIILDFSGDIYSDNFNYIWAIKHSMDLLAARLLHKPVVIFAESPGPFRARPMRSLARLVLNKVTLITTRESLSKDYLQHIGVTKPPVFATACPAFLLEPASESESRETFLHENIDMNRKPLIGVTICPFNMPSNPVNVGMKTGYHALSRAVIDTLRILRLRRVVNAIFFNSNRTRRMISDLVPFARMIDYLIEDLQATVILIPHVYDSSINSPSIMSDEGIARQLCQMAGSSKKNSQLKVIAGRYSPEEVKGLIGQCDLFISGRMHAAIAALSQNVPTVGLSYGRKFYGVLGMLGQESHVCSTNDADDIISKINAAWMNKEKVSKELGSRVPEVKKLALLNAELVRDTLNISQ